MSAWVRPISPSWFACRSIIIETGSYLHQSTPDVMWGLRKRKGDSRVVSVDRCWDCGHVHLWTQIRRNINLQHRHSIFYRLFSNSSRYIWDVNLNGSFGPLLGILQTVDLFWNFEVFSLIFSFYPRGRLNCYFTNKCETFTKFK